MAITVLLVDDDVDLVQSSKIFLESRGYVVRVAYTAAEARKTLEASGPPDVVVLDVMMETDSAGFHLANDIHQKYPDLPTIMLSGVNEQSGLPYRFEADPDWLPVLTFLEKPVDYQKLVAEIAKATKSAPPQAPAKAPQPKKRG